MGMEGTWRGKLAAGWGGKERWKHELERNKVRSSLSSGRPVGRGGR